ncbi:conserved hypothetical protein [Altererythrobacter sp. B11]|uniref:hypothetical protein n=1 Tax=Altererythrobacter sp. B11 TaxID=2060312 RepID=UPI000DC6EDDC|nr:hypothetical protein [Altererythrobacter sp. B11]BBC74345.1 conserved hypothetical protein [Altererythrobacter sp. B11]
MSRQAQSGDWFAIGMQGWMLWAEAGTVIWLRMMRLSAGGALADREAARMVEEKISAGADLAMKLATTAALTPEVATRTAIRHYRAKVGANRRRLTPKARS